MIGWHILSVQNFIATMVTGAVFDRHPTLRTVFSEGGINWVAGALQDCELTYGAHRELFDWDMKHRPSWYWHQHCYATFMTDPAGLELLHRGEGALHHGLRTGEEVVRKRQPREIEGEPEGRVAVVVLLEAGPGHGKRPARGAGKRSTLNVQR